MKHLFFGGIHPKYNKEMSLGVTDFHSIVPTQVVIPMQQHIGAPCQPLVSVGDKVLKGQKIGDGEGLCVPVHASVSGTVVAIEPRPHTSGRMVNAIVIENDKTDTEAEFSPLTAPLEELTEDQILHAIREAGIVGMGGAAFPGNVKALSAMGNVDTLIANACECEPYITADDSLLRTEPEHVLMGMQILSRVLNPKRLVLAVEDNKAEAIEKVKEIVDKDEAARNAYKTELDAIKNRYADWYLGEYLKAHVCEMDYQKAQALKAAEEYSVCEIVSGASFINPAQYEQWKQKLNRLKLANPQVTKQSILYAPTSVDSFNPTTQRSHLPVVGALKDELKGIYEEYVKQFHDAMEEPMTRQNRDVLNNDEKSLVEQFENNQISLNRQFARPLMEAIGKLQRNFTKIEITHDDMLRIFSRPMTKQQAIDALTQYIEEKSYGKRQEDIRIIIK